MVDTGLVNHMMGIQDEILGSKNINDLYTGRIAEQITGQELLTLTDSVLYKLNSWTREDKNATSEVDFIWIYKGLVIPVEVKSGKSGKLRSLHQFIDKAPHSWAVRIYSGKFGIEKAGTIAGKQFWLLNLPFYLINQLPDYLDYMVEQKR
jgi:predicted AAA+ superfamily ATPase